MQTRKTPIAFEGIPFIMIAACLMLISAFLGWKAPALFLLVVTLFIIYFFRNPRREIPVLENAVIAPADGVIIYIGPSFQEQLQAEVLKISIFMSVFDVHVNRAPISGRIVDSFYVKGKFLDVRHERATFENEQSGLIVENCKGLRIACVQVAGLIARRIVCYPAKGDTMTAGEIYGLIRFGSRLDVYLPSGTDLRAKLGDRTVAGETILGILP